MSSILKVDQIQLSNGNTPTAGDLGLNDSGTVLQVVQNAVIPTANFSVHSTSWTQLSIITPQITAKQANSKIHVDVQGYILHVNGQATNWGGGVTLYREIGSGGWTQLSNEALDGYYRNNQTTDHWDDYIGRLHYLDSPNHSAGDVISYRLYGKSAARNGAQAYFHHVSGFQTASNGMGNVKIITTLTEIAG